MTSAQDRELFAPVRPALQSFTESAQQIIAAGSRGDNEGVTRLQPEALRRFSVLEQAVRELVEHNQKASQEEMAAALDLGAHMRTLFTVLLAIAIILGAGVGYIIARTITRSLLAAVTELNRSTEEVASAASQVSAASQSLAQGASQQAASVEETSAAATEVNSMTAENAENTRAVSRLINEAAGVVSSVDGLHTRLAESMRAMVTSSEKVQRIVKLIDEIAFQTNILALNAAVEAARAGSAGQGFAVVADEVRNLAHRSADAVRETGEIVEATIACAHSSESQLAEVLTGMRENTRLAAEARTYAEQVAAGTGEQSRAVENIVAAVTQIQTVTERSAATAEETAAASEELTAQAQAMRDIAHRMREMVVAAR